MSAKGHRHEWITRLLREGSIRNQPELQQRLAESDIEVTQATLSRDLQELGVLKGRDGYVLTAEQPAPAAEHQQATLIRTLQRELRWIDYSGNMVLLKTDAGHANAVGVEIDRARLSEVLGTLAGDDTIFVLVRRGKSAAKLTERFRKIASLN